MLYRNSWQKELSRKNSLLLGAAVILLFLFYAHLLFPEIMRQRYGNLLSRNITTEKDCIEAISQEPTNANHHYQLGILYGKLSDSRRAEEEFKKAVLLDPQNIKIRLYLSKYFLAKDRYADFIYHFDKAVELSQNIPSEEISKEIKEFREAIIKQKPRQK